MSRVAVWRAAGSPAGWFVLVGATATLVHFGVVVALVRHDVMPPLTANLVAWVVAFTLSFMGHWRLSFRSQQAPVWRSGRRFFGVSVGGFMINHAIYALLLHLGWSYAAALLVAMAIVPILTYVVSRYWAFESRVDP